MAGLEEDAIDEILYLARANESNELESYLSNLVAQTKRSKSELLTAAIDPYSKNSALHYAAANGHNGKPRTCLRILNSYLIVVIDVIKLLLSPDTDKPAPTFINAINEAGNTALHWAALNGHLESVKLLMHSGADVTIFNRAGHDAVFEAEINDKGEVVDWLLGAVEELENGIGQTEAASSGDHEDEHMDGTETDAELSRNNVQQGSSAAASSVEDVRKRMEDMGTTDGTSHDG
jgi:hypothetical protein